MNCVKFTTANQTEKVKKLLTFGKVSSVYAESRQVSHENKMRLSFLDTINWDWQAYTKSRIDLRIVLCINSCGLSYWFLNCVKISSFPDIRHNVQYLIDLLLIKKKFLGQNLNCFPWIISHISPSKSKDLPECRAEQNRYCWVVNHIPFKCCWGWGKKFWGSQMNKCRFMLIFQSI